MTQPLYTTTAPAVNLGPEPTPEPPAPPCPPLPHIRAIAERADRLFGAMYAVSTVTPPAPFVAVLSDQDTRNAYGGVVPHHIYLAADGGRVYVARSRRDTSKNVTLTRLLVREVGA